MAKSTAAGIAKILEDQIEAGFLVIGEEVKEVIQANVHAVAFDTGRLQDSVDFATKNRQATAKGKATAIDMIKSPTTTFTLHIGTACPYAIPIEFGSAYGTVHRNPGGVEGGSMRERIKEWALRHGIPESMVSPIINNIMKRGYLPARQFMTPAAPMVKAIADTVMKKVMQRAKDAFPIKKTVIEVTISTRGMNSRRIM